MTFLSKVGPRTFWTLWTSAFLLSTGMFIAAIEQARGLPSRSWVGAYLVAMAALAAAGVVRKRRPEEPRPAMRRYFMRILAAMTIYVVVLPACITLHRSGHVTGWALYPLTLLPALPIVGVVAALSFYLREEEDEFRRMLQVRSYLWATGLLLAICPVLNFLANFDLIEPVSLVWVWPIFWLCWGVVHGAVNWAYR